MKLIAIIVGAFIFAHVSSEESEIRFKGRLLGIYKDPPETISLPKSLELDRKISAILKEERKPTEPLSGLATTEELLFSYKGVDYVMITSSFLIIGDKWFRGDFDTELIDLMRYLRTAAGLDWKDWPYSRFPTNKEMSGIKVRFMVNSATKGLPPDQKKVIEKAIRESMAMKPTK